MNKSTEIHFDEQIDIITSGGSDGLWEVFNMAGGKIVGAIERKTRKCLILFRYATGYSQLGPKRLFVSLPSHVQRVLMEYLLNIP